MTDPQNPDATPSQQPAQPPAQQPAPSYGQQPGYQQQGYQQPGYTAPGQSYGAAGYAPAAPKTLSIVSMVAGIASIFLFPIIGSIVGLITGSMGKKQEGLPAKPFWLTGIITSWVGLGLWVLGGLLVFLSVLLPLLIFGAAAGSGSYDY